MKTVKAVSLLFLLSASCLAYAECVCKCVNGEVRPLCSSSLEITPICAPRICPIVPPRIEPIQRPVVPPIGTTECKPKLVYDEQTHRYEWKTICQ